MKPQQKDYDIKEKHNLKYTLARSLTAINCLWRVNSALIDDLASHICSLPSLSRSVVYCGFYKSHNFSHMAPLRDYLR